MRYGLTKKELDELLGYSSRCYKGDGSAYCTLCGSEIFAATTRAVKRMVKAHLKRCPARQRK